MTIRGIAFPFQKGTSSFPLKRTDADVVADNIRRILETRKGERPMRPDTGSNVWDFVFESVGAVLSARIDHEVRKALQEGEPRATILSVKTQDQRRPDGARSLLVIIDWVFKREFRQSAISYQAPGSGG